MGWVNTPELTCEQIDDLWPILKSGDIDRFIMQAALLTMDSACDDFMKYGGHPIQIIVIKDEDQIELLSESTIHTTLESFGLDSLIGQLVQTKELMVAATKALVSAIAAEYVIHVSEAWMATIGACDAVLREKVENGNMRISDLPDSCKQEAIIVSAASKRGKDVFLSARIIRDGDKTTVGPVQMMSNDECKESSGFTGRFSDWWNNDSGGIKAVSLPISVENSAEWEYKMEENNDATETSEHVGTEDG
jgi:hypothetical protein